VAVGCAGEDYGKIVVYNFPKGELVYSPAQIDALINANPKIVKQFNLWDMKGSQMQRGKMIILPAGKTLYYIQPVFLMAETNLRHQIPKLQRIVMVEGQVAVMEPDVVDAYRQLNSRLAKKEQQIRNRLELSKQNGEKKTE